MATWNEVEVILDTVAGLLLYVSCMPGQHSERFSQRGFLGESGVNCSKLYKPPFEFTGRILKVTVDVSGKMIQDTEEEKKAFAKAQMARQ